MKVLLTFYGAELTSADSSRERLEETFRAWSEFDASARAAGVLLACEGLDGAQTATTVRVGAAGRELTDGPFIETKEQLGGFALLEVEDFDEALEWAARTPWNGAGHITEIRPVLSAEARV